jgi:hypothetical protein
MAITATSGEKKVFRFLPSHFYFVIKNLNCHDRRLSHFDPFFKRNFLKVGFLVSKYTYHLAILPRRGDGEL